MNGGDSDHVMDDALEPAEKTAYGAAVRPPPVRARVSPYSLWGPSAKTAETPEANVNCSGFAQNPGAEPCPHYMRTGQCKFGATCKFDHPEERLGVLNSMGYPLHPDQEDCPFYMKTGQCKFAATCRYNHPEGQATVPAGSMVPAATVGVAPGRPERRQYPKGEVLNSAGYPLHDDQEDCPFFMKNGKCKFGSTCRYNHPEGLATAVAADGQDAAGAFNSRGYPFNTDEPDCSFYMKTGTCKFGSACKYNHPEGVPEVLAVQGITRPVPGGISLNSAGYPLNDGQEDCAFFIQKGICKFGSTCKYNHPEGFAIASAQDSPQGFKPGNGVIIGQGFNCKGYPLHPEQINCGYYMKTGECKFGQTCRYNHPELAYAVSGVFAGNGKSALTNGNIGEVVLNTVGYPLNPGEADCTFYLKTGTCKFGASCRFNHPERGSSPVVPVGGSQSQRAVAGDVATDFNDRGMPLRAHGEVCRHYLKSGTCSYGETCRFTHPSGWDAAIDSSQLNRSGYPLNPHMEQCAFFMKTGICKFGMRCFKAHPGGAALAVGAGLRPSVPERGAAEEARPPRAAEVTRAAPRRPGQPHCRVFVQTGVCQSEANCKFDHPPRVASGSNVTGHTEAR